MAQPQYAVETATVQTVASDPKCRFIWTKHARKQMRERGITAPDVIKVLTKGQVTLHEMKEDLLWRVEGRNVDGEGLEVVVAVYQDIIEIKVVTAFLSHLRMK